MIKRIAADKLKQLSLKFPVVAVVGPRQSGKTTLVRSVFAGKRYVSLEDPDVREFALNDPRKFLDINGPGTIIDEIQRAPDLFSYIQTIVDKRNAVGDFILTGSQNFLLQEKVSQTLAGRVAYLTLLPFSLQELHSTKYRLSSSWDYVFKGFYPRVYDKNISPLDWYPNYIQSYVERDVRLIKNVTDLNAFQKFIKLCAGRTGQILNLSSLGNDCGITHNTARAWLAIMEAGYIVFLLQPYYRNFNKRIIKMPKLYFYDTGLASALMGVRSSDDLNAHYLKGPLFESFIVAEFYKSCFSRGEIPHFYYWRDKTGNEVDLIMERGNMLTPIEIKSGRTVTEDYFTGLKYWNKISGTKPDNNYIVYDGGDTQKRTLGTAINWHSLSTPEKVFR